MVTCPWARPPDSIRQTMRWWYSIWKWFGQLKENIIHHCQQTKVFQITSNRSITFFVLSLSSGSRMRTGTIYCVGSLVRPFWTSSDAWPLFRSQGRLLSWFFACLLGHQHAMVWSDTTLSVIPANFLVVSTVPKPLLPTNLFKYWWNWWELVP